MIDELKPCPFCGGNAETRRVTPLRNSITQTYDGVFVICTQCLTSSNNYPGTKAAIEHWNRRINDEQSETD